MRGDRSAEAAARAQARRSAPAKRGHRGPRPRRRCIEADPTAKTNDTDYVFITFILRHLPHGVIGLLVAAFFAAALSSKAAELNALASTTTVDFYRAHRPARGGRRPSTSPPRNGSPSSGAWSRSRFALFANLAENLIQAVNIVGSIFYGVVLGLFLVAFFLRRVGGTAVFWAALAAQAPGLRPLTPR